MKLLQIEQILAMHELVLEQTGGSAGVRDLGRLESAAVSQSQEVFGEELFKTTFDKAAALIRGIIGDHPFVDGNKRTALLTGLTLLEVNNTRLEFKEKELEDFAVKVAVDKFTVEQIAAWLKSHTKKQSA